MIYVYRRVASNGARELAEALPVNARKISELQMAHFGRGVRRGDVVICWGETLNPIAGVRILNGAAVRNKYEDAIKMREAGISTVDVSRTRPTVQTQPQVQTYEDLAELKDSAAQFAEMNFDRVGPVYRECVNELAREFQRFSVFLTTPPPVVQPATWLGRMFNHVGGNDLLRATIPTPDFFSKKEDIVEEYRIHSFNGKSIRAGKKAHREGVQQPHAWIRSYDGGWSIRYDGFESKKAMRDLANAAVAALGLQFGAVDIGKKRDGSLIVLECNRAPGLEGGTVDSYARAIAGWINGERQGE